MPPLSRYSASTVIESGLDKFDKVFEDTVDRMFLDDADVAVRSQIVFQRFQFD